MRIMGKMKKAAAAAVSLMLGVSTLFVTTYAAESGFDIENALDASECRQGGTLLLSVTLKGDGESEPQKISSLSGILEYDTSLFHVEKSDIFPAEGAEVKESSFDASEGTFAISYASDITVNDAGSLLSIRLRVAEDASVGKTTVCVTNMKWSSADDKQKEEIEHRIPARITIQAAEGKAGDVNADGRVDLTDARLVMEHYNGVNLLDSTQQKNADVNGDGKVNLTDIKRIMQYYNGEIEKFSA